MISDNRSKFCTQESRSIELSAQNLTENFWIWSCTVLHTRDTCRYCKNKEKN